MNSQVNNNDVARRRRALPLAVLLALSTGVVVIVGIAAVLGIGFFTSITNTLSLLNDKATLMVRLMESGVENHLDPAVDQSDFIERQVRAGVVSLDDREGLSNVLLGALAAAPQIFAVVFVNPDGTGTFAAVDADRIAVVEHRDEGETEAMRLMLAVAGSTKEPFWGDLLFRPNLGLTLINHIRPVWIDGEFRGLIVIGLTMPELSEFITGVGDQFGATGFIMYGDDRLLAHPNLTSDHPDLTIESPTVGLDRVGDFVVAGLPSRVQIAGFERAESNGISIDSVSVAGVDHVVFSGIMSAYGDVPWTVGAHLRSDLVDSELNRLNRSLYAGGVVLFLSIIAAVVMGRLLARPIRRIAKGANRIGELDLAAVEPLPASGIRELDDQANAFNRMLAGLKLFETYVPRSLVKRLVAGGDGATLESGERELTMVFTDIVGFTGLSEGMSAQATSKMLNEHFALLGACVEAEGGTIDKFIGDALMAFWGAPDAQADHAARAIRAAGAMVQAMEAENIVREERGQVALRIRVGIHTGSVMVGNIGAPGRINYTIVGDAVNTAQRLEGLGKELDAGDDVTVVVSAASVAAAGDRDEQHLTPAGAFAVKGKSQPLEVFRLVDGRNN